MITLASILFLGFCLGMRHATDPDHVVAVTTFLSRQRRLREAALVGLFWGLGHTATLLVVGGAFFGLGWVIPQRLGLGLDFCVAIMLVLLGLLNLRGMFAWFRQHGHAEEHDDRVVASFDRRFEALPSYRVWRPIVVGAVHGLAGSATVALLVLPVIHGSAAAMAYLLVFGVGTIAGMLLITSALAAPITYAAAHSRHFQRYAGASAGMLSLAFGVFLVWQIGFVQGLFVK